MELEAVLVSLRIFFMNILALPRGKQHGINGSIVNVPSDIEYTLNSLPRPINEMGLVPLN